MSTLVVNILADQPVVDLDDMDTTGSSKFAYDDVDDGGDDEYEDYDCDDFGLEGAIRGGGGGRSQKVGRRHRKRGGSGGSGNVYSTKHIRVKEAQRKQGKSSLQGRPHS